MVRDAAAASRRTDAFPDNALIRQQAKELRAMEMASLEEFMASIKSIGRAAPASAHRSLKEPKQHGR